MKSLSLRLFSVLLLLAPLLWSATPNCSLRQMMQPEEFEKAGLSKLTEEELLFLELRLFGAKPESNTPAAGPAVAGVVPAATVLEPERDPLVLAAAAEIAKLPKGEAAFGKEEQLANEVIRIQRVPDEITSRIPGRFEGWSGRTVFRLENGQIWKQIERGTLVVSEDNPIVHIKKGLFGVFYLGIEGYGSRIKVKRVE